MSHSQVRPSFCAPRGPVTPRREPGFCYGAVMPAAAKLSSSEQHVCHFPAHASVPLPGGPLLAAAGKVSSPCLILGRALIVVASGHTGSHCSVTSAHIPSAVANRMAKPNIRGAGRHTRSTDSQGRGHGRAIPLQEGREDSGTTAQSATSAANGMTSACLLSSL